MPLDEKRGKGGEETRERYDCASEWNETADWPDGRGTDDTVDCGGRVDDTDDWEKLRQSA